MRHCLILAILTCVPSFAQELHLEEVEVKEKKEIISKEEITEGAGKDTGEILEDKAGVWKLRKGAIANDIVIRGFQKSNLNFMIDEGRIYNACPNRMDPPLFHVDPSEIESVEVIKGPYDVENYGTLGGSVKIKTQKPTLGFKGRLSLKGGSFGYINPSLKLSYGKDPFFGMLGYSFQYSKPYVTGDGKPLTDYADYKEKFKDSTAFNINTLWLKGGYKRGKGKLEVSYTAQKSRDILYPYLMMDAIENSMDRVSTKLNLKGIDINAYYSQVSHLMNNSKRNASMFMETDARSETYGAKIRVKGKRLRAGLEVLGWLWDSKTTMGSSTQNTIPRVEFLDLGIFGEYSKRLSKNIGIKAGLRIDKTSMKADPEKANTDMYFTYHNTRKLNAEEIYPSGNVQIFYEPGKNLRIFGKLGHAFRSPDPQERFFALNRMGMMENRYGDWVGNPNLKGTKNTEIDAGIEYKGGNFNIKASLFYSILTDFITVHRVSAVNSTGIGNKAKTYTNVNANIYGGEISGIFLISQNLFIDTNLSYTRGTKEKDPSRNIYDTDIAEIPPLKGRVALRYDKWKYFAQIETQFQATQDNVDSDLGEKKTPGWAIVNLKAGVKYKGINFLAGINNLFNKEYYQHLSYLRDPFSTGNKIPEPGRNYYLNLEYAF